MKYHFFWNGPFSNWDRSPFSIDGMTFNCGEQYMMYHKALLCKDFDSANKVMQTTNPRVQKFIGRQIKNYNEDAWSAVRFDIVKNGLREKFLQNPMHMKALKSCAGKTIVEASPYDAIWGIGFSESDAMDNISEWGENLLGKILTFLCEEFIDEKQDRNE